MSIFEKAAKAIGSVAGPVMNATGFGDPWAEAANSAEANKANKQAAQKQMDFQQYNSNTAYQRAADDAEKAGFNRIIAFQQGGASVPAGASYTANPNPTVGKGISDALTSGLSRVTALAGMSAQQQQTAANVDLSKQQIVQTQSQTAKNLAETEKINLENQLKKKDLPAAELKYDAVNYLKKVLTNSAKDYSESPSLMDYVKKLGPASKEDSEKMFKFKKQKKDLK